MEGKMEIEKLQYLGSVFFAMCTHEQTGISLRLDDPNTFHLHIARLIVLWMFSRPTAENPQPPQEGEYYQYPPR